jgi:hypothetical protein
VIKHTVPDSIAGAAIGRLLLPRLAGTAISPAPLPASPPERVVWVDGGDEVLVHLDSVMTQIVGAAVLVSIDLETDQTGRTPLVVAFAIGAGDDAGLVAATDQLPRGNGMLAARWGAAVRDAAWGALLSLAGDHAAERGMAPHSLSLANGQLHLTATATPPAGTASWT